MLSAKVISQVSIKWLWYHKFISRNLQILCEPCKIRRWAIHNGTRTLDPHKPDSFRTQFAAYNSDRPASRPFQCQPWWQSLAVICSTLRPSLSLFWCRVDLATNRQIHTHTYTLKAVQIATCISLWQVSFYYCEQLHRIVKAVTVWIGKLTIIFTEVRKESEKALLSERNLRYPEEWRVSG